MRRSLTLLTLLACSIAAAQTASSVLTGVVTDPTGAVVPGAVVTLHSETPRSGRDKRATTDASGRYTFTALAAGSYQLRINVRGFAPLRKNLSVAGPTDAPVRLALAGQKQEVTVDESSDARAAAADPGANSSAIVVKQRQLAALSDDPDELAQQLEALAGPAPGPMGGQIYIDGFLGGQLPPKSAIREVRVNSNPYSPEYDRPGFGRVDIFTKPGSEAFHADALAQYNNQYLNSRNPLLTQSSRPPYQVQMYQLNLGGPIAKNKASFALSTEHREIRENALILATTLAGPLSQAVTTPLARTTITPRVDYTINAKNTLVARYQDVRVTQDNQGVGGFNLPSRAYNDRHAESVVQLTETAMLNSRAVNETRVQYLRSTIRDTADSLAPAIIVANAFASGGASIGNSSSLANNWEGTNVTSLVRGKHAIKWGGRLRAATLSDTSRAGFSGAYTFYSLAEYQQQLPAQFSLNAGSPTVDARQFDAGLFAGDDWRVRPNITLSYGLRYEAQTNHGDARNFAPRFGAAWSPHGRNPKTVVRAGAGAFYDRIPLSATLNALRYDGVTQQSFLILDPSFYPLIPSVGALSGSSPQLLQPVYSNVRNGRTYQASLSLERQLGAKSRLTATYLASRGVDLANSRNINAPLGAGAYPLGNRNIDLLTESSGTMRLNQLVVNPTMNFKRFSLLGYYALSYGRDNNEGQPADPYNLRAEWGPSSWGDVRHKFVVAATTQLPWKFSVNPFLLTSSGQPYNITTGLDPADTGFAEARPAGVERNSARGPATASLGLRVSRTTKHLTLSASTLNALNHTNLAPPVGDLSSPYFGKSIALADLLGHMGKSSTYNRRIDLQLRYSF